MRTPDPSEAANPEEAHKLMSAFLLVVFRARGGRPCLDFHDGGPPAAPKNVLAGHEEAPARYESLPESET
jgi:hypothetical protein